MAEICKTAHSELKALLEMTDRQTVAAAMAEEGYERLVYVPEQDRGFHSGRGGLVAEADEHSLFSASGAAGWTNCPGRPALEAGRKTSNDFADSGTASHMLAEMVIQDRLAGGSKTAADFIGLKINVKGRKTYTVDSDRAERVDTYVDTLMSYAQGPSVEVMAEQRVHYHTYLGVDKALAWGTSDGVVIIWGAPEVLSDVDGEGWFPPGDELQVHDLKDGQRRVEAQNNAQLRLYALGTLWQFEDLADFTRVRMVIHQPRLDHVSEELISVADLKAWAKQLPAVAPAVLDAYNTALSMRTEGRTDLEVGQALDAVGLLRVTETGCAFCDACAVCPPKIGNATEAFSGKRAAPEDFDDLTVDGPAEIKDYGSNYLARAYALADDVEQWLKSIRAEMAHRVLNKGETFDGVGVYMGKQGNREFRDKGEAELFVKTKVPAPIRALCYETKLKSPAQLEKALKTSPVTWASLQGLIWRAPGKPHIAPLDPTRKQISHKASAEDFEDLSAEDQPAERRGPAGHAKHPFR